jgi:hypothetical protein
MPRDPMFSMTRYDGRMMRKLLCLAFLFASSVAAADPSAPAAIKTDYDNVCNALERSGADKADKGERAQRIASYLTRTVKTPEVKAFLGKLPTRPPAEAGPALKKAAAAAGYTGKCPLADEK